MRKFRQLFLAIILLLGSAFAFTGLDWDEGYHLHPDERFLTMVETDMSWPESLGQYFDETESPLNPRNVGWPYFVYGTLTTTIVKGLSILVGMEGYDEVYLVGRVFSGVCFLGTIFLVYLFTAKVYRDPRVSLLASFFFACSVLPIQNAHFFTVDSACTLFITAACYALARTQRRTSVGNFFLVGLFFGLAMATKLSIFTFALVVTAIGFDVMRIRVKRARGKTKKVKSVLLVFTLLLLSGMASFMVFRIAQPEAFKGPGFWGLSLSDRWMDNILDARDLMNGEVDTPPGHQWTNRTPLWFPWKNMVIWGMGVPLGILGWLGWAAALVAIIRSGKREHLIPVIWVGILFFHQGTQWVKSMRYFLPIYPMLAVLASWALWRFWDSLARMWNYWDRRWPMGRVAMAATFALIPLITFLWACAFMSIYLTPHTRVRASEWMRANITTNESIANEHWDDALPLPEKNPDSRRRVRSESITFEWYADDSKIKLRQTLEKLDRTDYIVLSSNRLYDSIPRLPMRFPMTIAYYNALFNGELGFERVAEFTSYPGLFGLTFPDQSAEEAFSVYDHPRVQIFKKTDRYSPQNAAVILGRVNWDRVRRLSAREATELSDQEWREMTQNLHSKE
ncbi:MAG: glycosyltransferase family 39 protein [Candidatus Omnitrophica bacterium]|nr:glycosyltransferase family 39 protein [Candidatus Omnitrophota bacterium]